MPTLTFATGFEHGSLASAGTALFAESAQLPGTVSGTPVIETGTVHHGTKALRLASGDTWGITAPASTSQYVASVWFYIVSLPASTRQMFFNAQTVLGTARMEVYLDSTGLIEVSCSTGGGPNLQSGPTLATGTWHRLDVHYSCSGTSHVVHWSVNGVAQTDATGTASNTSLTTLLCRADGTSDIIFDCWVGSYTSGDYPLGDGGSYYVLGYAPDSDTDISQVGTGAFVDAAGTAISGSNPAWDNLDSRDFTQSAERVEQTATSTGFIEVGFEGGVTETPIAVMAECALRADSATTDDIEVQLRTSGGTTDSFANGDPSETSNVNGFKCYATEPGVGAWTAGTFNNIRMRFGFSGDANPDPWVCALLFEVAFFEADVTFDPATQGAGIFQPESYDLQLAE